MSGNWVVPEAVTPVVPDKSGDLAEALSVVADTRDGLGIEHDIGEADIASAQPEESESAFYSDPDGVQAAEELGADPDDPVEDDQTGEEEGPDQEAAAEPERSEKPQSTNRRTQKIAKLHDDVLHYQGTAAKAVVAAQGWKAQADHWKARAERAEQAMSDEGFEFQGDNSPAVQNRMLELDTQRARTSANEEVNNFLSQRRQQMMQSAMVEDQVDSIVDEHKAAAAEVGMDHNYTLYKRVNGDMRPPKEIWQEMLGRRVQQGGQAQQAANQKAPKPVRRRSGKRSAPKRADTRSDIDQATDVIMRMRGGS